MVERDGPKLKGTGPPMRIMSLIGARLRMYDRDFKQGMLRVGGVDYQLAIRIGGKGRGKSQKHLKNTSRLQRANLY